MVEKVKRLHRHPDQIAEAIRYYADQDKQQEHLNKEHANTRIQWAAKLQDAVI